MEKEEVTGESKMRGNVKLKRMVKEEGIHLKKLSAITVYCGRSY